MLKQTDFSCPAKQSQHPDAWKADTPQCRKGEHIGLTQDCKQENYLRLGKYNTLSAGSGTNIPDDYKAKQVLT